MLRRCRHAPRSSRTPDQIQRSVSRRLIPWRSAKRRPVLSIGVVVLGRNGVPVVVPAINPRPPREASPRKVTGDTCGERLNEREPSREEREPRPERNARLTAQFAGRTRTANSSRCKIVLSGRLSLTSTPPPVPVGAASLKFASWKLHVRLARKA